MLSAESAENAENAENAEESGATQMRRRCSPPLKRGGRGAYRTPLKSYPPGPPAVHVPRTTYHVP
jgi:hypothetical protein